ncbi:unnamed protein product, partial [marine sediment metagenome]
ANAVKEQRKIEPRLLPREKFIALLKYLGVSPGPEVTRIKTCIEEAIADGEVSAEATVEKLVAVLKDKNVKLSLKNTQIRP